MRCPNETSLTIFALLALALGFDWLSTSNVIGQNLPVAYRFNGTNAFATVNYIVQYSYSRPGNRAWEIVLAWDMPMTGPKQ